MNRIPNGARRLKRVAAATAIAVGAALLASPGAAQAQTINCASLGADPGASSIAAALETAMTCDVEVRITNRTGTSSRVYATPQGQLHLVYTADPTQARTDGTYADPTLVESDGALVQRIGSAFAFAHTNQDLPLARHSAAILDWSGAVPVPTYGGPAVHYDDLAPGLDLSIDASASAAELRFTAADPDAWSALSTGLSVARTSDIYEMTASGGALRWDYRTDYAFASMWTTPFTVRDAAGTLTNVDLTLGTDGALTVNLPEDALADVVFPLNLSAQWGRSSYVLSEWGSVTSAAPDLAIDRGRAGLGEPYFEAAGETGDALAGRYCDTLADADCATGAQAESYWGFHWPDLEQISSADGHTFRYQVDAASFSVDAAAGTSCTAPALALVEEYQGTATWNDRPAVLGDAGTGACEDGTAVYDVADALASAWKQPGPFEPITFAATGGADTARLEGGSARLDVYLDTVGFYYLETNGSGYVCNLANGATTDTTPQYGGFPLKTWRPDLVDAGLTWQVEFKNAETGEVAFASEPKAANGTYVSAVSLTAEDALADGAYEAYYRFVSTTTGVVYEPGPCGFIIDTERPQILDVAVEPGEHYVGDVVEVEVTVADEGFPGHFREVRIECYAVHGACGSSALTLTQGTTAVFEIELTGQNGTWWFSAFDTAGNAASESVNVPATASRNDFDGDGHQDLVTVRRSDGKLLLHSGNGDGTFDAPVTLASGWEAMTISMAGDLTGDGLADLLARDDRTGYLYTYPGNGTGGFSARTKVGSGWNSMNSFTSGADYDEDGLIDLLGLRKADGTVYFYPGRGDGTFGARATYDDRLYTADSLTSLGDINGDGYADLLVRNRATGGYTVYSGYRGLDVGGLIELDASLLGGDGRRFSQVAAVGDLNGDGFGDLVGVDSRTGELVLRSLDREADALVAARTVGSGWGDQDLPVGPADTTNSFMMIGSDIVARRASDGKLFVYRGNGYGGFLPGGTVAVGTGWNAMDVVEKAGDFNGDGFADLIAREKSTGTLYLYPGVSGIKFGPRVKIGTGWSSLSTIIAGYDFNGDGRTDILAREQSTGYLWLYPGKGDGRLSARVKVGSGWNGMREITAAGDLDHDGNADVVAIRNSDGCLYFYGGRADGTLKAGVKTSCSWAGYDSVAGVGDFNGDGHADWLARRQSDGALYLYKGNGTGGSSARVQIGTGWNAMNLIA
jgi:hypothetical protein